MIDRLIPLVLTSLIFSTTTKRVFSTMNLVRTILCIRMKNKFQADHLIIYIEKEIVKNFTANMIIYEFHSRKDRHRT